MSAIPPATGINYSAWFATGFVFQYLVRKRNFAWWSKFNYVTSAALDSGACFVRRVHLIPCSCDLTPGTVLSALFIFFTLQVSVLKRSCLRLAAFAEHGGLSSRTAEGFPLIGGGIRCTKIVRCAHYSPLRRANDLSPSFQLRTIVEWGGSRSHQGASLRLMYLVTICINIIPPSRITPTLVRPWT